MEIEHFSHHHTLILRDEKKKKNDEEECSACELPISSGRSYGCSQCKEFVLHKSCAELPKRIQHPFHPQHSLTLLRKSPYNTDGYTCRACTNDCRFGFVYHCASCTFDLDVGCASLAPTMIYEGHEHLLTLFERIYDDDEDEYLCKSCGTLCSALVLRCVDCNFNVHKSCADKSFVELPKQIKHVFHPLHPLTLRDRPPPTLKCDACKAQIDSFSFHCEECDFTLCVDCTPLAPTIKYEAHHHLLTLFEEFAGYIFCNTCTRVCHGFVFRCVECNFSLHPHCLPSVPLTIQHECHVCPLTLTHSVPEDADRDEYYCDACGKVRDRYESVYYCADCSFIAHIKCVISEVLPLLIAEQEKIVWPKKAEIRPASSVGDEVMDRGVSVAMPSETVGVEVTAGQEEVGVEVTAELVIAKLEGENAKLRAEVEALTAKLEALERELAQCVASKMPSERDKCLSEASALE